MITPFELDIRPGSGLGLFELGTSLWTIIDTLRRNPNQFPQVDVKYDPELPLTSPLILHLRPHLDLLFSGKHQRLHTVSLRRLRDFSSPMIVRYRDVVLSSPEEVLRRVGVSRTFGPTYPMPEGEDLRYPGLWFCFEEDGLGTGIEMGTGQGKGKGAAAAVRGGDRDQEVKRIIISQKTPDGKVQDVLEEIAECSVMNGDIERAVIKVHEGIRLYFYPTTNTRPLYIRLNETTAQDLMLDLGPPLRVHYKEDERMTIHSQDRDKDDTGGDHESDYFYNYFQHGVDFFISGSTHTVKKILLHSNIPGSPLFQRYKRCNWEIEGDPEDDEDDTPPRKRFYERFETISHFINPKEPTSGPSMVLNRTDEEDGLQLPNATTRLYGFDGIILEVLESSYITSITLF